MKKAKLLFINPAQFGYSAGYFHYCIHLQEYYEIIFVTFDQGLPRIEIPGISVLYIDYGMNKIKRLTLLFRKIFIVCYANQIDLLFTVYFKFCFLLPVFARSKIKILDIRSGELKKSGNFLIWLQSLFFRHICILSDGLRLKLKISARKSFILSLGSEIYYHGNHDYSSVNLLYVGSLNYRNVFQTIEGLAIFLAENYSYKNKIHYYIIGFGSPAEEEKITFSIKKYNLQQNVTFDGRKQFFELAPYYEKCNIGIAYVPINDFYEFQPTTKIFEYVLSGQFCVATNTFENRRIITEKNGILCEDNALSFAGSLMAVFDRLDRINSTEIRETLKYYEWGNLIKNSLIPYFNRIQNQ